MKTDLLEAQFAPATRDFIRRSGSTRDPASSDEEFNRIALGIFQHQFESIPIYRAFCAQRGMPPTSVNHWTQIPALPVSAFKSHDVTSVGVEQRVATFHSSGTTGHHPSRHHHSAASLSVYEDSLLPWFAAHVLPEGSRQATEIQLISLTPSRREAPHSSLAHMIDCAARSLPWAGTTFLGKVTAEGWQLDGDEVCVTLERASASGQPVCLVGTAFSFVHLLDHLEEVGAEAPLDSVSRIMETGGYKGRSRALPRQELHRLIASHLEIDETQIVCEYGMSELSSQGYDRIMGTTGVRAFQFPPWARVRLIDPETGLDVAANEPGLISIVDLANIASVLALQTEDLGRRHHTGFELIGRVAEAEARGCSLMPADLKDSV
jgi:hypothetical protein